MLGNSGSGASGLNNFSNTDRRVGHAVDIDDIFGEKILCTAFPPRVAGVRQIAANYLPVAL
jgi:hypothetical protein